MALEAIDKAIAQPETINSHLSVQQPSIFGDAFATQTIVPTDLALFPTRAPSNDPNAVTQGELITHIFTEYSWAAAHGGFSPLNNVGAHVLGFDAQNSYRIKQGQRVLANVSLINNGSEVTAYRVCFSDGKCRITWRPPRF